MRIGVEVLERLRNSIDSTIEKCKKDEPIDERELLNMYGLLSTFIYHYTSELYLEDNMVRDNDIKECRITYHGEDTTEGSVFLTKQEYEIMKKNLDTKNWCNKYTSGIYTPVVSIYCDDFEPGRVLV